MVSSVKEKSARENFASICFAKKMKNFREKIIWIFRDINNANISLKFRVRTDRNLKR